MKHILLSALMVQALFACGEAAHAPNPLGNDAPLLRAQAPLSGAYVLRPSSGSCLQVLHLSLLTGEPLVEWSCSYGAGQHWTFNVQSDGTYQIVNGRSGMCLDVTGGSTQPGAGIQQWTCSAPATNNQRFTATLGSDGLYTLAAKNSRLCLDTQGAPFGTQLTQQPCTPSPTQRLAVLTLAQVADAPHDLTYSTNPALFTVGTPIPPETEQNLGGIITGYTVAPTLPAGLSLAPTTGEISGTPAAPSPSTVYQVTGGNSEGTTTVALTLQIDDVPPANLAYARNPLNGTQALVLAPDAPTSSGGKVVSYSISPSLLPGLTFDTNTGVIAGNPIGASASSSYTVTATNSGGSAPVSLSLSVASLGGGAVPVPTNGDAYFGAWINPLGDSSTEEQQTENLETQTLKRQLALHMHYHGWTDDFAANLQPSGDLGQDLQLGRTPVVTWSCGPLNSAVAASVDGDAIDQVITKAAQAFAAVKVPVFIRWNWEMNLAGGNKCMDTTHAAQYYREAWSRIHQRFLDNGATNVAWLWNPGGASQDPDPAPFYPGDAVVDWVGFDGYDKNTSPTFDFKDVFGPFYSEFAPKNKPILIGETGECQAPGAQQHYLSTAATEIGSAPFLFPQVKGFMYFDAQGQYKKCYDAQNWIFDSDGLAGVSAMGQLPFFTPFVP